MSTSTPIPVYTPGEPTGPPPAHLANEKDDKKLVGILKAHANLLTTRGRLTVDSEIQEANNQIKHIITQVEGAPLSKIQKMQIPHFSGKWWEIVENAALR
ncbi:unnamed protein product [Rhizophagus irregularis]|nr:unnamed protein product [Rhizophagus irregularis]